MLRSLRVLGILALGWILVASPARAVDTGWLPDDSEIVLTINFKQILGSDLVKAQKNSLDQLKALIQNGLPGQDEATKYLRQAGIDPFRDLTSLAVVMPGKKDPDGVMMLVEGSFQPEKFHAAAEEAARNHGDVMKITRHGQFKVIEVTPPGEKQAFIALVNDKIMVAAGNRDRLTATLKRAGNPKSNLKKEVQNLLETTNSNQSMSLVATGSALANFMAGAPIPNNQAFGPALKAIQGFSGAITIAKDIQFQLGIGTQDAKTAQDFAQGATFALIFIKGLAEKKAKEDAKFQPLVDVAQSLQATAKGATLLIRGEASVETIGKLITNFGQK